MSTRPWMSNQRLREYMRAFSGNWEVWDQLVQDAHFSMLFAPSSEPTVHREIRAVHHLLQFLGRTKGRSR